MFLLLGVMVLGEGKDVCHEHQDVGSRFFYLLIFLVGSSTSAWWLSKLVFWLSYNLVPDQCSVSHSAELP